MRLLTSIKGLDEPGFIITNTASGQGADNSDTFAAKKTEFRDREDRLNLQVEACGRGTHENADLAVKASELSQTLRQRWVTADSGEKRRYLKIVVLNFSLDAVSSFQNGENPLTCLPKGFLSR